MKKRSQARMLALQAMCLLEAVGEAFAERLSDFLRDPANREDLGIAEAPDEVVAFARRIAVDAWAAHAEHDRLLEKAVPQWPVARMPPVDRNILRIGLYEILRCPDVPAPVAIDEAIELAKRFGDRDSPAFVNGVLDTIRREMEDARPVGDEPQRGGAATDTTDATSD